MLQMGQMLKGQKQDQQKVQTEMFMMQTIM